MNASNTPRVYNPRTKRYGTVIFRSRMDESSFVRWDDDGTRGWEADKDLQLVPAWDGNGLRAQASALTQAGWDEQVDEANVSAEALANAATQIDAIEAALSAVTVTDMRNRIEAALGWNEWPDA